MKTIIVIEVEHREPMPYLADMIAGRAWSISGVSKAEVCKQRTVEELQSMGFTMSEISLGSHEVHRG